MLKSLCKSRKAAMVASLLMALFIALQMLLHAVAPVQQEAFSPAPQFNGLPFFKYSNL